MRYIAALLLTAFVAVKCMPRPDGLRTPDLNVPAEPDDKEVLTVLGIQSHANISHNGEVQLTHTTVTNKDSNQDTSNHTVQEPDHTDENGESVSQNSENSTTHPESETENKTETNKVKVEPQGVMMTNDESSTGERRENNTETGRQYYQETSGYDKNGNITQNIYNSEATPTNSSTTKQESSNNENEGSNTKGNNINYKPDNGIEDRLFSETTVINDQNEQIDKGRPIDGQSEPIDKDHITEGHIDDMSEQIDKDHITEGHIDDMSEQIDKDVITEGHTDDMSEQIDKDVITEGHTDDLSEQIDKGHINSLTEELKKTNYTGSKIVGQSETIDKDDITGGRLNGLSKQTNKFNNTGSQVGVPRSKKNQDDKTKGQKEVQNGQIVGSALGRIFNFDKDVYRQLERNDRALGLIRDDNTSIESNESQNLDFSKVRNDYLLTVAQSIHNAKIMSDGNGHSRILSPHRHSGESLSSNFLDEDAPYRTLAQRYGASPVSSHYANAQYIESRFGNLSSLFSSTINHEKRLNTGKQQNGSKKINTIGKSKHSIGNLFERAGRAKYGHDVANLHLTPLEWEERARKEALKKAYNSHGSKFTKGHLKKMDKIDPLVKKAILSRDLDDILKTAKTSAEITSAMKAVTGKIEQISAIPINKQTEIKIHTTADATSSNENKIFGHSKDIILGKPNYDVSSTFYDVPKDISQVITNKVDLDSRNDGFDTSVIALASNIMENTFDHSEYAQPEDFVKEGENKVVFDSFDHPRTRNIDERKNSENSSKYLNTEVSNNKNESDNIKSRSSNYSFNSKLVLGTKEFTVKDSESTNSGDSYDSSKTDTEKRSEITNDTTKIKVNYNSNDTAINNHDLKTEPGSEKMVDSDSNLNRKINDLSYTIGTNSTNTSFKKYQSLSTTNESVSEIDTSIDTTSQVLTNNESESNNQTNVEKVNENSNKTDTLINEPEVNSKEREIVFLDKAYNTSNENLSIITESEKLNDETIFEANESNVPTSQEVNKAFKNYDVSKYDEMKKSNITQEKLSGNDFSTTNVQPTDQEELENNNATNIDESDTGESDVADLKESVLNVTKTGTQDVSKNYSDSELGLKNNNARNIDESITGERSDVAELKESLLNTFKIETKDVSTNNSESEFVNLNRRYIEEMDTSTDKDSVIIDVSNVDSKLKTQFDLDSEFAFNITELIDISPATTTNTPATGNAKPAEIDGNNNMLSILNHKVISDMNSNSSHSSNFNTSAVSTTESSEIVNKTTFADEVSSDSERSERLYARSALETDDEFNLENTTTIATGVANYNKFISTATLDSNAKNASKITDRKETDLTKVILDSTETANLDANTYNTSGVTLVKEKTDLTKLTINSTDMTDNFESTENYLNTTIGKSNSETKINADSQTFDSKAVDIAKEFENTTDIIATDVPDRTVKITDALDTNTALNQNKQVPNDTNTHKVKSLIAEPDAKYETTKMPNIPADLNQTNLAPEDEKITDSTKADNETDEINILNKKPVIPESSIDNTSEVKENAGTTNNTSITAADSTSTTNSNTVNQTTKNRPVDYIDKTEKHMTIANVTKSLAVKRETESDTTELPNMPADLNPNNLAPAIEEIPYSTVVYNKTDEINNLNKKTDNPISILENTSEVKENAGTTNNTSITAADSTSTTNFNTVIQTTENRPVGYINKTEKHTTIADLAKSLAVKRDSESDTTESSNIPADLNPTNLAPDGKKIPDFTMADNKTDEINIFNKKTVKPESSLENTSEVKENAGTTNNTSNTTADSTSTTNFNTVDQATENRPVGYIDKTKKHLTIADVTKSLAVKREAESKTTEPSNIPADLNPTNLAPDSEKTPDSTVVDNKTDEINIFNKNTVKPESSLENTFEVKENAGTTNNTSNTTADSTSTTNFNTVDQATENRPVDYIDKTEKHLTIMKSDKSQTSVKSDKPETSIDSDKSQASAKSEISQTNVESTNSQATAKSDSTQTNVESTNTQATAKSDSTQTNVASTNSQATAKSETVQATDKSEKTQAIDKSEKTQATDKSEKTQATEKSEKTQATVKSEKSQTLKSDKSETIVKANKFLASVKSDREKEESRSDIEESTSRSDESSRSGSTERLLFMSSLDSIIADSASTSAEIISR